MRTSEAEAKSNTDRNQERICRISCALLCLGFYLAFFFIDGAVICADSHSYISMSVSREPFYITYLDFFRMLFGKVQLPGHITYLANADVMEGNLFYLEMAALGRCILAAVCTYSLVMYVWKSTLGVGKNIIGYQKSDSSEITDNTCPGTSVNKSERSENINRSGLADVLIMTCICLGVSLLCRFAAKRASMYPNTILTEGIAVSLFLLFIRFLFQYLIEYKRSALIGSAVLSVILISTRKQMYITLIMVMTAVIYVGVRRFAGETAKANAEASAAPGTLCSGSETVAEKHGQVKKTGHVKKTSRRGVLTAILCGIIAGLLIFLGVRAYEGIYSNLCYGESFTHSQDNRFVTTMVFYTSEREYAGEIEDEGLRDLFLKIYDECDAEGDLMHSAPDGLVEFVNYFGAHYDMVQLNHMVPAITSYVDAQCSGSDLDKENMIDAVNRQLIIELLPKTCGKIIYVFLLNMVQALANTVAKFSKILMPYVAAFWILYLVLMVRMIRRNGWTKAAILATLVLVSSILNCALVSLVIFAQTRYVIYNMPLVYMAMWIMMRENFISIKKKMG